MKKVQYIHKQNKKLKELEESFDRLCKLVLRINLNAKTLDANNFPEICYDSLLYTRYETQVRYNLIKISYAVLAVNNFPLFFLFQFKHLIRNLHANGSIVLSGLLSLLYLIFTQIYHEDIADLSDLSQCLLFVQNACKKMKSLEVLFTALIVKIGDVYRNEQVSRKIKNVYINFDASSVSIANRNISLQSPRVSFNFDQNVDDDLFYERLRLSPREGIAR